MRKSMDTAGAAEWSIDMADCKKVQKMIGKFDHGQLDIKQEEFFIQHVESCKDCREEFEIYYIVAYGLSEDENTAVVAKCYQKLVEQYDFKGLVELKLKNSRAKIEIVESFCAVMLVCGKPVHATHADFMDNYPVLLRM